MTVLRQVLPHAADVPLAALAEPTAAAELTPFAPATLDFCAALSTALARGAETRALPAVQALAFWMRRAELVRLGDRFRASETPETVLVPRGTVFHLPPANVDTMFVYSWLIALLTGNRSVIRLSTRRSAQGDAIVAVLARTLAEHGTDALRAATTMVAYGHDAEVTRALSARCDVRVIWGGDRTVETIRALPLPPHARELTFPDRSSLAVLDAARYCALDAAQRERLAERFYNDVYWFDQLGCSSPRAVVWRGGAGLVGPASEAFFDALSAVVRRKAYQVETGAALAKLAYAHRTALDRAVERGVLLSNEVAVLSLRDAAALPEDHPGGGLFFQLRVDALEELVPLCRRRDQTLSHFGFAQDELVALARALNGRGIDRMVPVGQALAFGHVWDGMDLLQEFTRRVVVQRDAARAGGGA